jgi:hypothetical protein
MRSRPGLPRLALLAAFVAILCVPALASAQDISFELRTTDGRSEYRVGELIPLQMQFTSNSKSYVVDGGFRFPELQAPRDEFLVDPAEGWSDPLAEYRQALSSGRGFFDGGGLVGLGRLGEKPVVLDLFLNRYVRFSKPGHYLVSVKEHRVSLRRASVNEANQPIELTSRPLSLLITAATPEWQQQQLASALEMIKKGPGVNVNACEIVSALGTPAAELAMADDLTRSDERPGCYFTPALLGLANRALVLEHMQAELENPVAGITPQFIESMATLTALEDGPATDFFQRTSDARREITSRLFGLLNEKRGPAKFAAISTLVNETLMGSQAGDSAQQTGILRIAAEVFDQLSSQAQATLLSAQWKEVSSPAMAHVLRHCAEADNNVSCGRLQGDILLARLQEISPSDAREVILGDMQKESPRFPATVLATLPDKELPEMDSVFRERLESQSGNLDATAGLIQRYATSSIAPAVQTYLDANLGKLPGRVEPDLIAYLLRVKHDVGREELRAALLVRNENGWYKYLLRDVAQRNPSSEIQPLAIDALTDKDEDVMGSAVLALAIVGDDRAKAALFERLEQWYAKWVGRQRDLAGLPGDERTTDDRYLGDNLIHSIATGAGWLFNQEDQQQLLRCTVTENQKRQVEQFVASAKSRPVMITLIDTVAPHVQIAVAQYNYEDLEPAERKMSQFPRGTSFVLQHIPAGGDDAQNVVLKVQSFLEQHAMRVSVLKAQ